MRKRTPPKVQNKGQTRAFYIFSSMRQSMLLKVRSKLEYRACLHFEIHQDLQRFDYEPETFTIQSRGTSVDYTPDFRVQLQNEKLLYVEAKYTKDLEKQYVKEKIEAWQSQKPDFADFIVLTEKDLTDVHESNCRFILQHGCRWDLGEDELEALVASLPNSLQRVSDLLDVVPSVSEALRLASVLHWRCLGTLDLTQPIGIQTVLRWRNTCTLNLKQESN